MSDDESGSSSDKDGSGAKEMTDRASWTARKAAMLAARKTAQKTARREAYQKAKQRRANDPRFLQLKQVAKARRREQAERMKEQRRAVKAAEKSAEKASRSEQRSQAEEELRTFYEQGRVRLSAEELLALQHDPAALLRGRAPGEERPQGDALQFSEALQLGAVVANDIAE